MSICLNMVIHGDTSGLHRTLESARPYIHQYVLVDTTGHPGVGDDLLDALEGLPGTLMARPWLNPTHNRTEALYEAIRRTNREDHILFLNAGEELIGTGKPFGLLPEEAYVFKVKTGLRLHYRVSMVKSLPTWRWIEVKLDLGYEPTRAIFRDAFIVATPQS